MTRTMKIGLVILGLLIIYAVVQYSRRDYLDFDARRQAWHRRCDQYVGQKIESREATVCAVELQRLLAEGRRKGWNQ
jgi:hypothetical protein